MTAQSLTSAYPILENVLEHYKGLWHINRQRRDFILRNLKLILKADFNTPKLGVILAKFLMIEQQNAQKDGIVILRKDLITTLWDIYGKLKSHNNAKLPAYLKHKGLKLNKEDLRQAKLIHRSVLPLYQELKHPQFTANVELQQYCIGNSFCSDLAISNYQARTLFALNLQAYSKPLIPVVFSAARFRFNSLQKVTPDVFKTAITYYKKQILFHFFKNPSFGRVEIGIKPEYDDNYQQTYHNVIHLHAFVDPNEYALFKMAAKKQRHNARKSGKYNHLLELKCRELKKKQTEQSFESFLQRECDYALKFTTLEGLDNKDYYNPKKTRLNSAAEFHQEHSIFINNTILPLYKESLLFRKAKYKSFSELKTYFKSKNIKTNYILKMQNVYSQLEELKPEKIKTDFIKNVPECITKTGQTVTDIVSDLKLKIEPVTKSKKPSFVNSLKQILPKFLNHWPQKPINKRKPPD